MARLNLYVCGQKAFGAEVCKLALCRGHNVLGVSSPAWSETNETLRDRLRAVAEDNEIPWRVSGTLNADTLPPNVDLILAAHSHDFIGRKTRLRCKLGAVGYHPSLLPLHRGRDAVRWAIKMRERVTGGSIYWLSDNMDAGDIAAQEFCFIRPGDDAETLWRRDLFPIGLRLFEAALNDLEKGILIAIPQDRKLATWEPSWERPPVYRPDLVMLGALDGFTVVRQKHDST